MEERNEWKMQILYIIEWNITETGMECYTSTRIFFRVSGITHTKKKEKCWILYRKHIFIPFLLSIKLEQHVCTVDRL